VSPEVGLVPRIETGDPRFTATDGIRVDDDRGYSINYGYYGGWEHGIPVLDGEGRGFFAAFAIELLGRGADGRELANELWERRAEIAALVIANQTDPAWNAVGQRIPACRLSACRQPDGTITIGEYDHRRWRATLPARPAR
jgi:hypothetical protein